ncbi:Inositol 2-dehydrogenase/D-chiro-inositol 3-dehydrogenase [Dyadobacter sp. CECT 9275]|uniref:Inositol 2-dehydrogenase/D-chiro-inositol 3-dehydrogenase n=1 Tax=Dyadobacter helix TaxID=2822344 RepID=A0A916NCV6_9BACT|nr:Gfo/Idh/MocA family oxidoreductase [Dyadobacter sp. CECT 9275]CAG5007015.1 Inositol 2-dehydrogenase/D-chiro-inositol 3-dehydrogenase [Dyadobacter sp. CECT 9275]
MSTDNKPQDVTRRDFLQKSSAAALGSFFIVPRHVLGKGFRAPSDKLNIAGVGIGGKGFSDISNAWNNGAENVVALCDVDWNLGKRCFDKFPTAKKYKDFRKMLEEMDKDIDAVTISTPDHTHAVIAMAAMRAGKDVYVQKPMTHNIHEARTLTEAARQYKRVSQMGNQGASNPGQQQMIEWFKKGLIGTVRQVEVWTNRPVWPQGIPVPTNKVAVPDYLDWDLYVGPAEWVDYTPAYHPFKWHGWWNFGTGALGDMGCHLIDSPFRVLELGYPTAVECSIGSVFLKDWTPEYIPEGCPPSSRVEIKFPASKVNKSEIKMTWHDGGLRPFHPDLIPANDALGEPDSSNGAMLIGDKGVMTCATYGKDPKVYLKSGEKLEMPKDAYKTKYTSMPEFGHQVAWTDACKAGFGSKEHKALTSSFDYSGPLTETVIMGNLAIRSYTYRTANSDGKGFSYPGRKQLLWDGKNMKITNFEEANQFVKRKYRGDWKL